MARDVALPISFRLKRARFMSHRAWRNLHYFGYAVWGLSLCHGIAAGTDSRSMPAVAAYSASAAIVCASAWWRWFERPNPPRTEADERRHLCDLCPSGHPRWKVFKKRVIVR